MASKEALAGRFSGLGGLTADMNRGKTMQPGDYSDGPVEYKTAKLGGRNKATQNRQPLARGKRKFFDEASARPSIKSRPSKGDRGYLPV